MTRPEKFTSVSCVILIAVTTWLVVSISNEPRTEVSAKLEQSVKCGQITMRVLVDKRYPDEQVCANIRRMINDNNLAADQRPNE